MIRSTVMKSGSSMLVENCHEMSMVRVIRSVLVLLFAGSFFSILVRVLFVDVESIWIGVLVWILAGIVTWLDARQSNRNDSPR